MGEPAPPMSITDLCSPCGVVIVNQSEVKTVEQCGAFTKVAHPGCHCLIPCLCQAVNQTLSMRQQQLQVQCETKTKDNVFVTVKVAVQYQINSQLTSSMGKFGYSILASPITDIDPDAQVKRAMNEINKMKRLRVAAGDEGEAVKIRAIKEAEAAAATTEIQAKADAEAKYMQGQGIARQRQAIITGLRDSVNAFKSEVTGVDAKNVLDLMIVTQYFDMMKEIGAQAGDDRLP